MSRSRSLLQRYFMRHLLTPGVMTTPLRLDLANMTIKRFLNLKRVAAEYKAGKTVLRSLPPKLVIEATNVCNLNCPGCFTGLGENGRVRSSINFDLFTRVLDEIGDTLIDVEFYNWGEPLLCKSIYAMIEAANRRGIGTQVTTNFSVPFDEAKAEALVRSGLKSLGVSLDGVSQEAYQQYRKGGDAALVMRNARLVADAKKRLNSATPHMTWSFHVFEHNVHEMDQARAMSADIGFDELFFAKGYTVGNEWDDDRVGYILPDMTPARCNFLWHYAVIHNDGGVAPCCGTFYREDDLGVLALPAGEIATKGFRDMWNSPAFQSARGLFQDGRQQTDDKTCGSICGECPLTKIWHGSQAHVADGRPFESYRPEFSSHDGYNYFMARKPAGRDTQVVLKKVRPRDEAMAD